MIDTGTVWAIISTPLGIAAGLGWMRCARMLKVAKDTSAYLDRTLSHRTGERDRAKQAVVHAQDAASYYARLCTDTEDRKAESTRSTSRAIRP